MNLKFSRAALPFVLATLLMPSSSAEAQISAGANNNVITLGVILLGNDTAYDPVHKVYLNVAAYGGVYGVFVSTAGTAVTAPFSIGSASSASFGHYPRAVYSPELNGGAGGFLVTWQQGGYLRSSVIGYVGGVASVSEERLVSDGSQGGVLAVPPGSGLAYSATSHRILASWATSAGGVQGRFVDAASGISSGVVTQLVDAPGAQEPALAWNAATDEFGLVYGGYNAVAAWVGFKRISASTGAVSAPTTFGFAAGTFSPSVAVNTKSNHYIVGWSLGGGANGTEFDQNGNQLVGVRFLASRLGTPTSFNIAFNPVSDTFLAVSEDPKSIEVAGIELQSDGSPISIAVGLSSGAGTGSFVPRVTSRTDAREWEISYARNMNALASQLVSTASIGGGPGGSPPPPPPPPPSPSLPITITSLTANRSFPTLAGITATWTLGATGGKAPLEYKFWRWRSGSGWTMLQEWSTANFATEALGAGWHKLKVDVRGAGGSAAEATRESDYFWARPNPALSVDGRLGAVVVANGSLGTARALTQDGGPFVEYGAGTIDSFAGAQFYPADFDGNGLTDFFLYNSATGQASRAMNTGSGFLNYPASWAPGWTPVIVDFNGDGLSDLFLYNRATGLYAKAMSTGPELQITYGTWGRSWRIYPGDFNGDGLGDLFLYNDDGASPYRGWQVRVLARADGGFDYIYGPFAWAWNWTITTGDFNGDGITDLFLYRSTGEWYKVLYTGPGLPTYVYGSGWDPAWKITSADFNGDHRSDLFLYKPSTGIWYVVMAGADGSWAYYPYSLYFQWGPNWEISVSDFNADGRSDLLLYNATNGWAVRVLATATPGNFGYIYDFVGPGQSVTGGSQ